VIHVIVFKIMIETVNWNSVSIFFGFMCFASYYVMCWAMNLDSLAPIIQPEINGEFNSMFTNFKAIIVLIIVPFVALLPDITILMFQKVFYPTPTDAVMIKQKLNPKYAFEGWAGVYVPRLPSKQELQAEYDAYMRAQQEENEKKPTRYVRPVHVEKKTAESVKTESKLLRKTTGAAKTEMSPGSDGDIADEK
jgi:hypothetical protein